MDGIFGDRTKSALTRLSTTKAEDLYPINRITNHNRELISRALDISSRITDTLYPSIPLGLVQRQLNEAGFRDVNGELLVDGDGNQHYYAHLDTINVKPGDILLPGEKIGTMGNTGYSEGIHLHYEVQKQNGHWSWVSTSLDPTNFLK